MKSSLKVLTDTHLGEWKNSKVSEEIIRKNVISIEGDEAFERLLYALGNEERVNTGRLREKWLKRYDHLFDGGWWCSGVDLTTFKESEWGCLKPNKPRIQNGKPLKYEHPPQTKTGIFALGSPQYWKAVIGDNRPILITEGAKKAGCLLSHDFPAIGLSGVYNFLDEEELKPEIKVLCKPGREFCIVFDQDKRWEVRNNVASAIKKLAHYLEAEGCLVTVLSWEYEHGKGIDDFVAKKGAGELQEIFDTRLTFEEYWEKHAKPKKLDVDGVAKLLKTRLKGRLAWNELASRVELDGEQIELSGELVFRFLEEFNVIVSERMLISGIMHEAKQNKYHPVRRYLDSVAGLDPISLDDLSDRYFGTNKPLYNILLKKWLLAAVARIYQPGCKFDDALILQGKEGVFKSTFFRTLGGEWFDDSFGSNIESAKSLQVLHKCWIQEWAEFDQVSSKKEFNVIKSFLGRQSDCFVRQYGRDALDNPRMSVMCGSVNPQEFLRDENGDRRFWAISIPEGWTIPISLVQKERDNLWASAVQAYRRGESWALTPQEKELLRSSNEQFRDRDAWFDTIENYLSERKLHRFSIERILIECLGVTLDKIDTKVKNRVRACLVGMGCQPLGVRVETEYDNRKRRVWELPAVTTEAQENLQQSTTLDNGQQHSDNTLTTVNICTPLPTQTVTGQAIQDTDNGSNTKNGKKLLFVKEEKNDNYDSELLGLICAIADNLKSRDPLQAFLLDKFGHTTLEKLTRGELMDTYLYLDSLSDNGKQDRESKLNI